MKRAIRLNKRGQFTIIAALLVAVILVVAVLSTYSAVRYNTVGNQPQVLTAVDQTNNALRQLLGFTVAYYGSIMNVTGNYQFAYGNASNYLSSGLTYIANVNPELGLSFNVTNLDLHVTWFMSSSYSYGQLNVTYSLTGLGLYGLTYAPESKLGVQIISSDSGGHSLVSVIQDEDQPLNGLAAQNFVFLSYQNSTMDWQQTPSTVQAVLSNGTYLLNIPPGVNPSAYQIQVNDARGISVTASSYSQYNSTLSLNGAALKSALSQNFATIEVLQNGAMRWLGQNLNSTTQLPLPHIPVKDIHVNQTFANGTNKEVSFQIEDWASNYSVPLGLTNGYTIFGSNQMIVYQINAAVAQTTVWWNGSDVVAQTPYAYTPGPFSDNVATNTFNNGKLAIQFNGGFNVASTIGGLTSTASFMRINNYTSDYGAGLAYVITNAPVRDIVQQEAEWGSSHLATSCPNIYANMVLTLPAGSSYYTYQLKLMFVNSTNQPRNITDLSPIQLTSSPSSLEIQTENGTSGSVPIVVNGSGTFYNYNYPSGSMPHHWSQIINAATGTGTGIMFTDATNQQLYAFDSVAPASSKGALNVSTTSKTIEFSPVTLRGTVSGYKTPNASDITWYGAVATFDSSSTPIYSNVTGTPTGLWPVVDQPPTAVMTTNAVTSAQITLSPSAGSNNTSVTVSGSGFTPNTTLTIMFDQNIIITSTTNSSGSIPPGVTFIVPSLIAGSHSVTAVDTSSNSASAIFNVIPTISISPINGNVGSIATVTGSTFAANSALTATFDGSPITIGGTTSTDSTGSFSGATFSVPASTAGLKTVIIRDSAVPTTNIAQATFNVTASTLLSPNSGTSGTSVTVTGTGYGPSKTITVKFEGITQTTSPATITSGTNGSFVASFTIPTSTLGAHTITASDGTNTASTTFSVTPGTLAKFAISNITDQIAGTSFQITVTAQDTNGNTISGYSSSVGLSVSGAGTINPSSTGTSGWSGSVWTGLVTLSKTGSGITVTASDGTHSGVSNSFTVNPGSLDHFGFAAIGTQTAGSSFGITITAYDSNNNVKTDYTGNPALTYSAGSINPTNLGAFASGTKTGQVTVTRSGSGLSITATDGSKAGTSGTFNVNAGALSKFSLDLISTQVAGTPYSISITAQDANGNTVTSYVGTPTLTSFSWSGSKNIGAFVGGAKTGSVTSTVAGSTTIVATDGVSGTSNLFTVNPGALSKFIFSTISTPQTVGTAISGINVTAIDAYSNTVTSYVSSTALTETGGGAGGSVTPSSVTFNSGVWSGALILSKSGSGVNITATYGLQSGTSNSFTVNAGTLDHFDFNTISSPQAAGVAFSITITAKDSNGYTVTNYTGSNTLSASSGTISPTSTTAFNAGVLVGSVTLTQSGAGFSISTTGGGKLGQSNTFFVSHTGTLGMTSAGSTNYPTGNFGNTNSVSSSLSNSPSYLVADKYTTSVPITATTIYVEGRANGNAKVSIYTDSSGTLGTKLFTEVSSAVSANTWKAITIPTTYLSPGTYWIVYNVDTNSAIGASSSPTPSRLYKSYTYSNAFPATGGTGWTSGSGRADCTYVAGASIEGCAKATKAILSDNNANIQSLSFYVNPGASGNFRLAIYSDISGPANKLWESSSTAATAGTWNTVNIVSGTPTSLILNSGTYWLVWQWDSLSSGPSYTAGSSGDGNYAALAYGSYPATWSGGTSSSEKWSIYASYVTGP